MNLRINTFLLTLLLGTSFACTYAQKNNSSWKKNFKKELSLMGHRNWILIVDAAYPLQSSAFIKTIVSNEDIITVTKEVVSNIQLASHVSPIIYQDKEFGYMKNAWSPGCETLRTNLDNLLKPFKVQSLLHNDVFEKLDKASKLFSVLVIKTTCTTPYSSIFIELNCGYWPTSAEKALREEMKLHP